MDYFILAMVIGTLATTVFGHIVFVVIHIKHLKEFTEFEKRFLSCDRCMYCYSVIKKTDGKWLCCFCEWEDSTIPPDDEGRIGWWLDKLGRKEI